jgi:signal transduction histidine kinase
MVGVALTFSEHHGPAEIIAGGALVAHALVRTLAAGVRRSRRVAAVTIVAELIGTVIAVGFTGWWVSPYVFTLLTAVITAGFTFGFGLAVPLAVLASMVVTFGYYPTSNADARFSTEGASELVLVALVAGYGRRIFGQAEERTVTALSRLSQLTQANALLQQLNALAQALPASLDLRETVASTMDQVRNLVRPDAIAVFLWDSAMQTWSVAGVEGARLPSVMDDGRLPVPVRRAGRWALTDPEAFLVDLTTDGPGLTPAGRVGIYAPLVARQTLVGVLVAESQDPAGLAAKDLDLFSGLAEQAALAMDNAIWFGRLRTVGAEEERTRIARDLHDRVAQALAYLAFELDRIVDLASGTTLAEALNVLRDDVRRVVTEVRDTLYDLRTDVSDTQDLASTMTAFLERVQSRSGLEVSFDATADRRLAVPLERELWRITQEAIVNVERHARARSLHVGWTVTERTAEVLIADDGIGFPTTSAGRLDSYGLLGMRERADAIGATLIISSNPGQGTQIRCRVEVA